MNVIEFDNVRKSFSLRKEEGFFRGDDILISFFKRISGKHNRNRKYSIDALKDINLKIRKGECIGIVGPNGAGKTTLLKLACSLLLPDEGDVYVCGLNTKEHTDKTRSMTMIIPGSRFFGFNELLSPRSNLLYWAAVYQIPPREAKARVEWALELTGLSEVGDRRVMFLSSGMRQKLNLARALLADREIWAIDEPTVHLDPWSAREIRGFIRDVLVRKLGYTVLLSSQNLSEVEELCDRVVFLLEGRVVIEGTIEYIRSRVRYARKKVTLKLSSPLERREEDLLRGFRLSYLDDRKTVMVYVKDCSELRDLLAILPDTRHKISDLTIQDPPLEEVLTVIRDEVGG